MCIVSIVSIECMVGIVCIVSKVRIACIVWIVCTVCIESRVMKASSVHMAISYTDSTMPIK